jgi:hypothetical protein
MRMWVYNPHTGGKSIPPGVKARTEQRILDYAAKHYFGKFIRADVRFRGALCYIDVYTEPDLPRGSAPPPGETCDQWIERLRNTPHISAGFATSGTKTVGASLGIATPTKSTNPAS